MEDLRNTKMERKLNVNFKCRKIIDLFSLEKRVHSNDVRVSVK